jgi:hypothetical protein
MTDAKESRSSKQEDSDKSQRLVPPGREPIHQGQQFDEMQRQHKKPDGTPREENES